MTQNFKWKIPPSRAFEMNIYIEKWLQAVYQNLKQYEALIEKDMKDNAIWEDQTGNARQSLICRVIRIDDKIILVAAYGKTREGKELAYGKWLELANGGKYAIILPTLQEYYPKVWATVKRTAR